MTLFCGADFCILGRWGRVSAYTAVPPLAGIVLRLDVCFCEQYKILIHLARVGGRRDPVVRLEPPAEVGVELQSLQLNTKKGMAGGEVKRMKARLSFRCLHWRVFRAIVV